MVSVFASVALLLALESAVPSAPLPAAPEPVAPIVAIEEAVTPTCDLAASIEPSELERGGIAEEATPMADPVCIQTYCKRKSMRCDLTGVHPTQQCCQYNCYTDSSCTTVQNPPNVCGPILLP